MPEFEEEEELLEEEEEGQASEMYEHHRIEADNGQNLLRVDKFLMSHVCRMLPAQKFRKLPMPEIFW